MSNGNETVSPSKGPIEAGTSGAKPSGTDASARKVSAFGRKGGTAGHNRGDGFTRSPNVSRETVPDATDGHVINPVDPNDPLGLNTPSEADGYDSEAERAATEESNKRANEATHIITLSSHEAQKLWRGVRNDNPRKRVVGCLEFAKFAAQISQCSREHDDPYADMKLIEIERELDTLDKNIRWINGHLRDLLRGDEDSNMTFQSPTIKSFAPVQYPVLFASGYGYRAASLLGKFDTMVQLSVTARNCAAMSSAEWTKTIPKTAKDLRRIFEMARRFRYSGASRHDFAAGNARAHDAIERYGALPDDVLNGTRRPQLLPVSWRAEARRSEKGA